MQIKWATILTVVLLSAVGAWAGTETVLYNFTNGSDGGLPIDAGLLVRDSSGNLYGTTFQGGSCGYGTVFELSGSTETVLHNFCPATDGGLPYGGVILDSSGNIYGTTSQYGSGACGTVFKLSGGIFSVLHSFTCGSDGSSPYGGVVQDKNGNLYGTTYGGGDANGDGVAFGISSSGTFSVIYTFCSASNCADGQSPQGGLAIDTRGNLYGTTVAGGASNQGTVFELSNSGGGWTETVLHSFAGSSKDGAFPSFGSLTLGTETVGTKTKSVIFGVTGQGGAKNDGTVYQLIKSATGYRFSLLHSFSVRSGANPLGTLTLLSGTLYGTTELGGKTGSGSVFELIKGTKGWALTVLYSFKGRADGTYPHSGVVADSSGNLYGVAEEGGSSKSGVVYEVTP
jgi:uncharacterized repeat protein (TIGR03803 family)